MDRVAELVNTLTPELMAERIAELEAERDLWRNHAINQYARRTGISLDDAVGLKAIEKLLNET